MRHVNFNKQVHTAQPTGTQRYVKLTDLSRSWAINEAENKFN